MIEIKDLGAFGLEWLTGKPPPARSSIATLITYRMDVTAKGAGITGDVRSLLSHTAREMSLADVMASLRRTAQAGEVAAVLRKLEKLGLVAVGARGRTSKSGRRLVKTYTWVSER